MALLSLVLCDLDLNPLPQVWAMEEILSATIVMEELDQFSPHSITVSGSFRQNLGLLTGMAAVQIIDDELGTIAYGLIVDPEDQITASDEHTITLNLPNFTEILRFSTTGQGWVAGYATASVNQAPPPRNGQSVKSLTLSAIVARLGALRRGWSASCDANGNFPYILRYEDATILGALLQAAEATGLHARQVHDAWGTPIRSIELGLFGQGPAVQIISPDGGDVQQILANNPEARVAQTITRHPADCSKVVTTMTPLGGGSGINQVRFRRLFRILFDPTYDHYATKNPVRPGDYNSGVQYYFPEADMANFPIHALWDTTTDPTHPAWRPARLNKTDSQQFEYAVRLDGGADGFEYTMSSNAALQYWEQRTPHNAEFRAPFTDSSFTYVDSDIYNQEMSERALYVAAKAQLGWYGLPQQSVTVTTVGQRRPVRAGEKVQIHYDRIGVDGLGYFTEVAEEGVYYVVSVVRQYGDQVIDTWTLTNNAKHPPDATSTANDASRGMVEALRVIPTTTVAIYPLDTGRVKIDSQHPLTKHWEIPKTAFRVQQCKILVSIFPVRHDLNQAHSDGGHQHDVDIPALTVSGSIADTDETAATAVYYTASQLGHAHASTTYGNQGGQNITAGASQWGHNHGSSVPATGGGNVANSGKAGNVDGQINSHQHTMTFGSGGDPGTGASTGILYYSGTSNPSYGGAFLQGAGKGGTINTAYYNQSTNTDHGHGSSTVAGGGGNVSGTNLNNPALNTNNYSGFKPGVDSQGTGWPLHTVFPATAIASTRAASTTTNAAHQSGSHTHALDVGIFETNLQVAVRVDMQIGGAPGVILTAQSDALGQNLTSSMQSSVDITPYLDSAPGQMVTFNLWGVPAAGNPDGLTEVELSGFGVIEMSGVGSQVLYA